MEIALTTPTGHVGAHLVRALIRAGLRPRLLMRDPSRLDPTLAEQVDVRRTDLYQRESVIEACTGADALYWVTPPGRTRSPLADYRRAARSLIAAVEESGIRRVVLQSSVGAEKRGGAGDIDGLALTEVALDATDADVTHLRCGYFMSNLELQTEALHEGQIPVILPIELPMAWVAPRDIAEVAAGILLNLDWAGKRIRAVHGPEDLSWDDVAKILTEVTGRPVEAVRIADEEMAATLRTVGLSPEEIDAILGMSTGMRDGFVPEQSRTVATTTPTTLRAWAQDHLLAAVS